MKIRFDAEMAGECGVQAAIVAEYLWERTKTDDFVRYRDDGIWVRCPLWEIRCQRPMLTKSQIERALQILRERNVIRSEKADKKQFDHTNWYRFTDYGCGLMEAGWDE